MNSDNQTEENHRARSSFVRGIVQRLSGLAVASSISGRKLPKRIVQFWDDLDRLPGDVASASKHGGRQRTRELKDSFSTSAMQENLFVENWATAQTGIRQVLSPCNAVRLLSTVLYPRGGWLLHRC